MINTDQLTQFLLKARSKTYASDTGRVKPPLLDGSKQFEYQENDWLYRDIYNQGNKKFIGLETVYYQGKPVWSESYYGNFENMSEEEADRVLRKTLIDKWDSVRIWNTVEYSIDEYLYLNEGSGDINEVEGSETITKNGKKLYYLYYAGGLVG